MTTINLFFAIPAEHVAAFRQVFAEQYQAALAGVPGFVAAHLSEPMAALQSPKHADFLGRFNHLIRIQFASENDRAAWAQTPGHHAAFGAARKLATEIAWSGHTVLAAL